MKSDEGEQIHRRARQAFIIKQGEEGTLVAEIPEPRALATVERLPLPKPRRNKDWLYKAIGSTAHGAGLRPSSRGIPSSCRRLEQLHSARHFRYKGRGISLSEDWGSLALRKLCSKADTYLKSSTECFRAIFSTTLIIKRLQSVGERQ